MMIQRPRSQRVSPTTVAIFLNVVVLAVLSALMAAGVERSLTARSIQSQIANLHDNLTQLIQARQERLAGLTADLARAQADLGDAQAQTPKLGAPFELYRRGFAMAPGRNVAVQSIQFQGADQRSTALGPVVEETYAVVVTGSLPDCIAYLRQLESDGGPFLAVDRISLRGDALSCRFDALVIGTDESGRPISP
jgi:hypothetical protein